MKHKIYLFAAEEEESRDVRPLPLRGLDDDAVDDGLQHQLAPLGHAHAAAADGLRRQVEHRLALENRKESNDCR